MKEQMRYAAVTPARNESANLRRLGECLVAQRLLPDLWVVVDDGSSDDSKDVVSALAAEHPWIVLIDSPGPSARSGPLHDGRVRGRDVIAFNAGLERVREQLGSTDVVLKLDADVSFEADFFVRLLAEFGHDDELGITGATCYELEDGEWVPKHVTGGHVRGATRAYRWSCLPDVMPLEEQLGWDGIDEVKARLAGWSTRSIPDLPFYHHRPVGARDGARRSWESQGMAAYFIGYRPSYLVLRSLFQSRRDPRALAMILGYLREARSNAPRCADAQVRAYVRDQQRLLRIRARAGEALGRG